MSIKSAMLNKAALNKVPVSGTFELTPRCNMNCKMCYIRRSPDDINALQSEISAEDWIEFGKECADNGMLFLLLTGGEPFLRKDFRTIYEGLKKLGLYISINSNGTFINKETVEWLKKDPPSEINITLYGASRETYMKLCGFANGFDLALQAIQLLTEAGIKVNINVSLTKLNVHDLEKIVAIGKKYDVTMKIASYMFPPVRKDNSEINTEARFTAEECGDIRLRTLKAQFSEDEYMNILRTLQKGDFSVIGSEECERPEGDSTTCMAGRSSFWITYDGRMTPCGMINSPIAFPFRDGMSTSWKYIAGETDKIRMPVQCTDCKAKKICKVCMAITTAEGNGDASVRPEYLCRSTERFLQNLNNMNPEKEY